MSGPEPIFHKLEEFEPATAQNRQVLGHWKSLCGDERVPLWEAFDPLDIIRNLDNCAILEFVTEDMIKIRLFGNKLVERLGADFTGKNFLDLFEPDRKAEIKKRNELLRTRPAVLRTITASQTPMGVPVVAESMLFPFRGPGGAIARGLLSMGELSRDRFDTPIHPDALKGDVLLQYDVFDL